MSSILRALKKLENDPRHLDETRNLDTQFVPLADTDQQKRSLNILLPVLGAGLVCGLVILAGWWFFAEKIMGPPIPQPQAGQQTLQLPEMTAELAGAPTTPPPANDAPAPGEPAMPITELLATVNRNQGDVAGHHTLPSRPATGQAKEAEPVTATAGRSFDAAASETAEPAPATEIVAGGDRALEPPAGAMEAVIPLLSDPDIKLQAITWSKNPHKRIAVINNRILHQGDVVAGYRLVNINLDDVELSAGGEKWKLLFRIK